MRAAKPAADAVSPAKLPVAASTERPMQADAAPGSPAAATPGGSADPATTTEPAAEAAPVEAKADDYADLPPAVAEKLRRQEAARIGEITKERNRRREAETRAAEAKAATDAQQARLDKIQATLEKLTKANEQPSEPKPDRTQFDRPEAYEEALLTWHEKQVSTAAEARAAQALKAQAERQAAEAAQRTQAEYQAKVVETWKSRVEKARETVADFETVALSDDIPVPNHVAVPIMESENGPDVLYHLGKNPTEAKRIAELAPLQAALEIGRISARLTAQAEAAAAARISRVAPPIRPVGGAQPAVARGLNEITDMKEYARLRLPQLQAERAGVRH